MFFWTAIKWTCLKVMVFYSFRSGSIPRVGTVLGIILTGMNWWASEYLTIFFPLPVIFSALVTNTAESVFGVPKKWWFIEITFLCCCYQEKENYTFTSETDTEVIPKLAHYIYHHREEDETLSFTEVVERVISQLVSAALAVFYCMSIDAFVIHWYII
jgi:hypothetical protein